MATNENFAKSLIDTTIEGWKFSRLVLRLLNKMDSGESSRYGNQLRYFCEKLAANLEAVEMRIVNLEGQPFDPGMAVNALNAGDFSPEDQLMIEQMLEPVIMGPDGVVRSGTIMLRKAQI